jgi:fimbrial chaperone protein
MRRFCLGLLLLLVPQLVCAAGWQVIPIRLDLGVKAKSGVIRIINRDSTPMPLQMSAVEWTQDENGKDVYTPTKDLIFFPRIMTVEADDERMIRVGIRQPALKTEKTYRLFIEQIPEPSDNPGAKVAVAIRFGVPIFVTPPEKKVKGLMSRVVVDNGQLDMLVKNIGNSDFRLTTITARGLDATEQEVFNETLTGWYLLNGVSRTHQIKLPDCSKATQIEIEALTDQKILFNETIPVTAKMCSQ